MQQGSRPSFRIVVDDRERASGLARAIQHIVCVPGKRPVDPHIGDAVQPFKDQHGALSRAQRGRFERSPVPPFAGLVFAQFVDAVAGRWLGQNAGRDQVADGRDDVRYLLFRKAVELFPTRPGFHLAPLIDQGWGEEARAVWEQLLESDPPDMAILDVKMPRMDGMELLRRLRQRSELPVIFLTSKDEEIDELFGLKMGADDFIRKPFSQRLLVERVKAVLRRATLKDGTPPKEIDSAKVLERGLLRMDPERHTCTWKGEPVTLTVTEFLILQALATRPGVVKSRNALMDAAYDDQVYVDDRTIDSHIKRLRKKFKVVDDDFEMIETLYGVGYRFKE